MNKHQNIAIIPARGGSKRIPKKNIKAFFGKPILAYSIETALKSGLFDEVMVSTDDEEIAKIARQYGAKVPFMRSKDKSDDFATLSDVISEVLKDYKDKLNRQFEHICCLLPTAPFIDENDLKKAYNKLNSNHIEAVFPLVRFSYPIQRALKIENNFVKMIWPENKNKRSQDLEPAFHDSGLFYWIKNESFQREKTLWTDKTAFIELPQHKVQDIDTNDDWKMAELKYKLLNG